MAENPKDRILAWERAHLVYPVGFRDKYLSDLADTYSGKFLQAKVRDKKTGQENRVFPLAVNYCQAIVNKLNSLLWGQYESKGDSHLISWRVPSVKEGWGAGTWEPRAEDIKDLLNHVFWDANPGNRLLYNWGLDSGTFGTGILSPRHDPVAEEIFLDSVPANNFHCIWNSDGSLAEAMVVESISKTEAMARHGWDPSSASALTDAVSKVWSGTDINLVERIQYWSPWEFTVYLDGKPAAGFPKSNPYCWVDSADKLRPGVIPFIILPNKPMAGDLFGYSDMDPVQDIVRELNHVMAMMGDVVSENAHPIKVLVNQRGDDDKWKLGADRTWRIFGQDADAKLLSYEGGLPNAHQYILDLQTVMEDTGNIPAVAYGRFKGTQGSSLMLQVEMMPALQVASWKRLMAGHALSQLADMILMIMTAPAQYGPRLVSGKALSMTREEALKHQIRPVFAPMLPKDDVANTNKQISLTGSGLRSRRKALEELDEQDIDKELKEIEADEKARQDLAARGQSKTTAVETKAQIQMKTAETTMMEENQKEAKGEYAGGKGT